MTTPQEPQQAICICITGNARIDADRIPNPRCPIHGEKRWIEKDHSDYGFPPPPQEPQQAASLLGEGTPPFEVIVVDGCVEKANGERFIEAEVEQFMNDFLAYCEERGLGFGGSMGGKSDD